MLRAGSRAQQISGKFVTKQQIKKNQTKETIYSVEIELEGGVSEDEVDLKMGMVQSWEG